MLDTRKSLDAIAMTVKYSGTHPFSARSNSGNLRATTRMMVTALRDFDKGNDIFELYQAMIAQYAFLRFQKTNHDSLLYKNSSFSLYFKT